MNQFHQFAAYFAVIIGSLSVVSVCVYGAVRSFRIRKHWIAFVFLSLIPSWFLVHAPLPMILWVIATPNPATPTNFAEYAVAPVYLAIAGFVCYLILRSVRSVVRSNAEPSHLAEYTDSHSDDDERLGQTKSDILSFLAKIMDHKKKIVGVVFVAIGAAAMSGWFFVPGVLFVVIGVSLIMDVRIWRS